MRFRRNHQSVRVRITRKAERGKKEKDPETHRSPQRTAASPAPLPPALSYWQDAATLLSPAARALGSCRSLLLHRYRLGCCCCWGSRRRGRCTSRTKQEAASVSCALRRNGRKEGSKEGGKGEDARPRPSRKELLRVPPPPSLLIIRVAASTSSTRRPRGGGSEITEPSDARTGVRAEGVAGSGAAAGRRDR